MHVKRNLRGSQNQPMFIIFSALQVLIVIKERICLDDKSKYCLEKHNYAVNGQNYRVSKCSVCVLHTNRSQGVLKSKKRKEKIKKH